MIVGVMTVYCKIIKTSDVERLSLLLYLISWSLVWEYSLVQAFVAHTKPKYSIGKTLGVFMVSRGLVNPLLNKGASRIHIL
jgi:hypothetical protein